MIKGLFMLPCSFISKCCLKSSVRYKADRYPSFVLRQLLTVEAIHVIIVCNFFAVESTFSARFINLEGMTMQIHTSINIESF